MTSNANAIAQFDAFKYASPNATVSTVAMQFYRPGAATALCVPIRSIYACACKNPHNSAARRRDPSAFDLARLIQDVFYHLPNSIRVLGHLIVVLSLANLS